MEQRKRQVGPVTGAVTAAAALTTVILWVLNAVWGVELPGEVQGAFTTLIVVIAGYLVPPRDDELIEETYDIEIDDGGGGEVYG